ncbi:hypothetical protein Snoj_62420 [Streptomyces nojiriensis]|uniref:Uncharacterized protein n=1 Tax=Streptomyces nojiriensis TaxID=66374 RepID=A0ABQ3SW13_9ACTN|nr:hypothetical protein GCM10010205_18170 [Streptomyces nojiriensis]GHI72324.1 hypothetical protein Snoj_62420 [Streptomyces nojiriensis]
MVVTGRLLDLRCGDTSILAGGPPAPDQPPCLFFGPLESDGGRARVLLWYDRDLIRRGWSGVAGRVARGVAWAIEIPSFPYR